MAESYDNMAGEEQDVRDHPDKNFGHEHTFGEYFLAGAKDWSEEVGSQLSGKGSTGYPVGRHTRELLDQDAYRKANGLDK